MVGVEGDLEKGKAIQAMLGQVAVTCGMLPRETALFERSSLGFPNKKSVEFVHNRERSMESQRTGMGR